jgi:hypothetical protein
MANRKNANAKAAETQAVSKASQPVKAGETPANVTPHITFQESMNAAATKIDALLRGGVDCVTYIGSALLVGYLSNAKGKIKLSVMREEFSVALGKQGLGGTQTKKYLDYGQKIAANMFKECAYGMEMTALLAATTPDKAHDAVVAWLTRHTRNKKTEHGFSLTGATEKLNVLGVFLGLERDPETPEKLEQTDQQRTATRRENTAKAIEKDPAILSKVPADKLLSTIGQVITFDKLVAKHVDSMTDAKAIEKELKAITAAYQNRIKALKRNLGEKKTEPQVSSEAAAA